jgi:hypothetical protein
MQQGVRIDFSEQSAATKVDVQGQERKWAESNSRSPSQLRVQNDGFPNKRCACRKSFDQSNLQVTIAPNNKQRIDSRTDVDVLFGSRPTSRAISFAFSKCN